MPQAIRPRTHFRDHPAWRAALPRPEQRLRDSKGRPYAIGHAEIEDEDLAQLLLTTRIMEVRAEASTIRLPVTQLRHEFVRALDLSQHWIRFHICLPVTQWRYPFSIDDFGTALHRAVSHRKLRAIRLITRHPEMTGKFDLIINRRWRLSSTTGEYLRPWLEFAVGLVDEAICGLKADSNPAALSRIFSFSPDISAACQQYLLYFGQFLQDLGIAADTQTRHEANRVLFSVNPASGTQAIGRIAALLNVYLAMSYAPRFPLAADADIAVVQLRANIQHLQSHLQLARGTIQAQDVTIHLLSKISLEQNQTVNTRADDKEPLFGKAVSAVKYRGKWFEIDVPYILRRLRRRFSFRRGKKAE